MFWDELALDLVALILISAGIWLVYEPAGLVVAGLGVAWLSIGVRARREHSVQGNSYKAIEVDE